MLSRLRMIEWLLLAVLVYAACITLRTFELEPQVQVVLWKIGNVLVAAHIGYWIDVSVFQRHITPDSPPLEQIRRALIIAATMLTIGLGL